MDTSGEIVDSSPLFSLFSFFLFCYVIFSLCIKKRKKEDSVTAVEQLLNYRFKNKKLLEEALTHASCTDRKSYQRLEFVGDAALGFAISNFMFHEYRDLKPDRLTLLRSANLSNEKLARVAVRCGLYRHFQLNAPLLDEMVKEFALAVSEEDETVMYYGGKVKAPKVLADIVESVAAAVYDDCQNLNRLWEVFKNLLEPIVTPDILRPQPITQLFELCQKYGMEIDISYSENGKNYVASVYVDGTFIASSSSNQKEKAKHLAAEAALVELPNTKTDYDMIIDDCDINGANEIDRAKEKLYGLCGKKRWPKPSYRKEREVGPAHEKKFICSVRIETEDNVLLVEGEERLTVKGAENSAAS